MLSLHEEIHLGRSYPIVTCGRALIESTQHLVAQKVVKMDAPVNSSLEEEILGYYRNNEDRSHKEAKRLMKDFLEDKNKVQKVDISILDQIRAGYNSIANKDNIGIQNIIQLIDKELARRKKLNIFTKA